MKLKKKPLKQANGCLFSPAVVTVLGENESFARTVNFLRRGDSFGVSESDCESRLYAKFHSIHSKVEFL